MKILIKNKSQSQLFAKFLAQIIQPEDVIGLCGDLGAGKTYIARHVIHNLDVESSVHVISPTFTLINEYNGRLPIYHMDFYRLYDPGELYDLGLWEYYNGKGVCLVEWYEKFEDLWPEGALEIQIDLGEKDNRIISFNGKLRGDLMAKKLIEKWNIHEKKPT